MAENKKIKVLVVDDSALIRALLSEILQSDPQIEVCATATDPYEARDLIKQLQPDVLTLDIEMPRMNGITFLKNLMRLRPMPVVMISTLTQEGAPTTLGALELGAVDFIAKPKNEDADAIQRYRDEIVAKVHAAAKANVRFLSEDLDRSVRKTLTQKTVGGRAKSHYLCAIGASTGGTEAIKQVVSALPLSCPPIVVTQHIPEVFSASFARRVDALSAVSVHEAEHMQIIEPGNVYIAPGHSHLRVRREGTQYFCTLDQDAPVNRHRPAVETLFDSVVTALGGNCMGVLLTGMGADGAAALLRMRQAGARTICQDEASSVVWGMPGAAVKLGAAERILPLEKVAEAVLRDYFERRE